MNKFIRYTGWIFSIFMFFIVIYLIIAFKVFTFSGFGLLYFYTIFITTFMLSRIVGSLLYKPYKNKLNDEQKMKLRRGYEPTLSIVIPCKNESAIIYHTMKSCLETNYPKNKIQRLS